MVLRLILVVPHYWQAQQQIPLHRKWPSVVCQTELIWSSFLCSCQYLCWQVCRWDNCVIPYQMHCWIYDHCVTLFLVLESLQHMWCVVDELCFSRDFGMKPMLLAVWKIVLVQTWYDLTGQYVPHLLTMYTHQWHRAAVHWHILLTLHKDWCDVCFFPYLSFGVVACFRNARNKLIFHSMCFNLSGGWICDLWINHKQKFTTLGALVHWNK